MKFALLRVSSGFENRELERSNTNQEPNLSNCGSEALSLASELYPFAYI